MPSIYYYPIWLLTVDDNRNSTLADLFESDMELFLEEKRQFYDSLMGTQYHHKALYELLEVQRLSSLMLIKVFRANLNILNSNLPTMDVYRLKDKTKNLLATWRVKGEHIVHPYDNSIFTDVLRKSEKWDSHPKLAIEAGDPVDWNGIILSRLSDIHKTLHELFNHGESRILISMQKDPDEDQDIGQHVATSVLPAVQEIYNQLLGYIRFVNGL